MFACINLFSYGKFFFYTDYDVKKSIGSKKSYVLQRNNNVIALLTIGNFKHYFVLTKHASNGL